MRFDDVKLENSKFFLFFQVCPFIVAKFNKITKSRFKLWISESKYVCHDVNVYSFFVCYGVET